MNIKNQRKNITLLPDGRRFSWYDSGPETGIPVVFCTGAGMSGSAGFGIPYLADNNIRLITPDRPGLGNSSPDAGKSPESFAADVTFLMQSLGYTRFRAAGFSQGAVYAMALAYYAQVSALALISGQDQFDYPPTRALLSADIIDMQKNARTQPDGFTSWGTGKYHRRLADEFHSELQRGNRPGSLSGGRFFTRLPAVYDRGIFSGK